MNIGFCKIGKSIIFDKSKHGAIGGDFEAPLVFKKLAKYNPSDNFYLIGKSDYSRLNNITRNTININNNITDIWYNFKRNKDEHLHNIEMKTYIDTYFKKKNIKLDYVILYTGPTAAMNIYQFLRVIKNKKRYPKILNMFLNYVAPIFSFLNISNVPFTALICDPRYAFKNSMDMININFKTLSQYNDKIKMKYVKNPDDMVITEHYFGINYNKIETVFLIDKKYKIYKSDNDRKYKFNLILNQGKNAGLNRYPLIKEYIDDVFFKDISIYGKWDENVYNKDKRFKGPQKFHNLIPILENTRYTFMIPIDKGWVTSKFWEMIHYGVLPFFHPYYDSQNHLDIPDFLRVKSKNELINKINTLEKNNVYRANLINGLRKKLTKDLYNGKFVVKQIYNTMYKHLNIDKTYEIGEAKKQNKKSIFLF